MTPKILATILHLRDPRQSVHMYTQVLLALRRLLKEASDKDKKEILRVISEFRNTSQRLRSS